MKKMAWTDVLYWLAVPLVLVFALFPFAYAIASSFKQGNALFSSDFWPKTCVRPTTRRCLPSSRSARTC